MSYLTRANARLAELDRAGLRRTIRPIGDALDFSSNDYLGLGRAPDVLAAAAPQGSVGSGGSRLLAGAHDDHTLLEVELATFLKRERVLLFSSGYLAALGAIGGTALLTQSAYSDRENHACLIDALRLTRLERHIYVGALPTRTTPATIVSETVFSMSGRTIEPERLLARLGPDDVLLLDEAHALGVWGAHGAGLAVDVDDPRVIVMGTLSKSLGAAGGFVAGPAPFIELLMSTARSFIFDSSLPPSLARAARVALALLRGSDGDARRAHLSEHVARLNAAVPTLAARGPIVTVCVGSRERAMACARAFRERGLIVPAIRPPTVAPGDERLRITLRSDHSAADIDRLAAALGEVLS